MDYNQLYRGILRGFTSDVVGGPVDIAESLANLGLAGYGYAGNKLGLLDASQMPKLLSASPGTSEWFAQKAKNPDTGTLEYFGGRFVPAALGLAKVAAPAVMRNARAPVQAGLARGQRGALRVGGAEDLIPAHATTETGLEAATQAYGTPALYSPSIGITSNKVPNFQPQHAEGSVYLIPKVGAFDPATSASTLYNRDAYLPRHGDFRGPGLARNKWSQSAQILDPSEMVFDRGLASKRLWGAEGGGLIDRDLPEKMQGVSSIHGGAHRASIENSPIFRSYEEYEKSPKGAATLRDPASPSATSDSLYKQYNELVAAYLSGNNTPFSLSSQTTKDLLSTSREKRLKAAERAEQEAPGMSKGLLAIAAKFRDKFGQVPSEYAELQHYGLTPINQENWAGAILMTDRAKGGNELSAKLNGLPTLGVRPGRLDVDTIKQFQADAGQAKRFHLGQAIPKGLAAGAKAKLPEPDTFRTMTKNFMKEGKLHAGSTSEDLGLALAGKYPQGIPIHLMDDMLNSIPNQDVSEVMQAYGKATNPSAAAAAFSKVGKPDLNIMGEKHTLPSGWQINLPPAQKANPYNGLEPNLVDQFIADKSKALDAAAGQDDDLAQNLADLLAVKAKSSESGPGLLAKVSSDNPGIISSEIPSNLSKLTWENWKQGQFDYLDDAFVDALQQQAGKANNTPLQTALYNYKKYAEDSNSSLDDPKHDVLLEEVLTLWDGGKSLSTGKKGLVSGADNPWPFGGPEPVFKEIPGSAKFSSAMATLFKEKLGPDWDVMASDADIAKFYHSLSAEGKAKAMNMMEEMMPKKHLTPILAKIKALEAPLSDIGVANLLQKNTPAATEFYINKDPKTWTAEELKGVYQYIEQKNLLGTHPLYKAWSKALSASPTEVYIAYLESL